MKPCSSSAFNSQPQPSASGVWAHTVPQVLSRIMRIDQLLIHCMWMPGLLALPAPPQVTPSPNTTPSPPPNPPASAPRAWYDDPLTRSATTVSSLFMLGWGAAKGSDWLRSREPGLTRRERHAIGLAKSKAISRNPVTYLQELRKCMEEKVRTVDVAL